ncbi:hypothetical protein ACJMK2_000485 [Sinanodonta woodiana]|uniref:TGF-beta family profile domain-containing protein n=1 Tax=Sinanodonta woodiana TaxID=1069815 RepID=A0ABD3XPH2_SINWO
MYKVKSLTWVINFSMMFMSHLYKESSCESTFAENQMPDMTTEDSKHEILSRVELSHRPISSVYLPDQETTHVKSERVGADGPGRKQHSMGALFQMPKEDFRGDAHSERKPRHLAGQQPAGSQCQRHPMNVNFKTLGWDNFIIAPSGYNAYYCAGECPLQLANFNSTRHAQIQGLTSAKNPKIPKPCCVPTKLSSLQVLYTVNFNVKNEHWKDMIVDACGCL